MHVTPLDAILAAWQGLGLSLLSGFLYARLVRIVPAGRRRDALVGLLFGAAGVAAMLSTVHAGDGVAIDVRELMVAFGAMLGGTWGMLAALPCLAMRWALGGEVDAGMGGIVLAAVIGRVLARRRGYREGSALLAAYAAAGPFMAMHLVSAVLVDDPDWMSIGLALWLVGAPVYALGSVMLGVVVRSLRVRAAHEDASSG